MKYNRKVAVEAKRLKDQGQSNSVIADALNEKFSINLNKYYIDTLVKRGTRYVRSQNTERKDPEEIGRRRYRELTSFENVAKQMKRVSDKTRIRLSSEEKALIVSLYAVEFQKRLDIPKLFEARTGRKVGYNLICNVIRRAGLGAVKKKSGHRRKTKGRRHIVSRHSRSLMKEMFSLKDLSERMGVRVETVRSNRWKRESCPGLPFIKIGRRVYVRWSDFDTWSKSRRFVLSEQREKRTPEKPPVETTSKKKNWFQRLLGRV